MKRLILFAIELGLLMALLNHYDSLTFTSALLSISISLLTVVIDLLQELCQKYDKLHELMMGTMLVIGLDNRTNNVINDLKSKINDSNSSDKENQTE